MGLRRILRHGVRPRWLILEILPSQMGDDTQGSFLISSASTADLRLAQRFADPLKALGQFAHERLVPIYRHRANLIQRWAPFSLPTEAEPPLGPFGGNHAGQARADLTDEEIRRNTRHARAAYQPALRDFKMAELSTRAMEEILQLCRKEGIGVVLFFAPESKEFQSWYPTSVWREIQGYALGLSRTFGVPLVDARDWLKDADFVDAHHVRLTGAKEFTRRLGREVLVPLVSRP
jgi:hypothetical protein